MIMLNFSTTEFSLLVTALAAMASAIGGFVGAILSNLQIRKTESIKLIFAEKTRAYQNFIRASSCLFYSPTKEELEELYSTITYASLFSEKKTADKITDFCIQLSDAKTNAELEKVSADMEEVVALLRHELRH